MAIIREPMQATHFTQVPNHWIRGSGLSLRALGLLTYIVSHSAEYDLTVQQIITQLPDGDASIRAGMKELERLGFLVRHRTRRERGRFDQYDYQIVEFPQVDTRRDLPDWSPQAGRARPVDRGLRTPPKNTTEEDSPKKTSKPERDSRDFSNRGGEFPNFAHRALGALGYDLNWRNYIIREIVENHEPHTYGWWVTARNNGTLADIAGKIREDWLAKNRRR